MSITSHIGEQLKNRRVHLALSQSQVAEMCGVPQGRLSEYESGKRVPSFETLNRLVKALGRCSVMHDNNTVFLRWDDEDEQDATEQG